MNERVRSYLIEAARQKDKFVYYSDVVDHCELEVNISSEYGRKQLSDILGQVSAFENSQLMPRPLLSSLAIYKDQNKNDHGDGFYKIAEQLGKGSFKQLKEDLFGFTEAEECRQFWQNEENFKIFAPLAQAKQKTISNLFTSTIDNPKYAWADEWKDSYVTFVQDVKLLREAIQTNPEKTISDNDLFHSLSTEVRTYENFMRRWLKEKSNGISSRGQSVLSNNDFITITNDDSFKIIAKAIILEPNLKNYNAFSKWWYSNDAISNRPLLINRTFAACNPEQLSSTVDNPKFWQVINILQKSYNYKFERENNWNWFDANTQLTIWLDNELKEVLNQKTPDKLQQLIWRNIFVWLIYDEFNTQLIIPNSLTKKEKPKNGFESIPEKNRNFKGVNIDYETRAKDQKDLGDAGEELVKQYEMNYLERKGMVDKSLLVKIAKDGEGYDVLSFDDFGNDKYIEVKTTTGNDLTPFYLSENEVAFMRLHIKHYSIYRVFNYDEQNNFGEFFEIKNNVEEQLIMKPTQYKVLIKKEKN